MVGSKADVGPPPTAAQRPTWGGDLVANAGRITFQQRLGAHELTVAQVVDKEHFVEFVQSYLSEHYKVSNAPYSSGVCIDYRKLPQRGFPMVYLRCNHPRRVRHAAVNRLNIVSNPIMCSIPCASLRLERGTTKIGPCWFFSENGFQEISWYQRKAVYRRILLSA